MGQALSSETHSISGGDGYKYWVGLDMKVRYRGCKKTVYKGMLLGNGPRWGEKVVVKAFTSTPGTRENWKHEVVKADVTKQMVAMYHDKCSGLAAIRVIMPGLVQMDKVSKVNKWLEDRQGNRPICRDDWVSVEEYLPGVVKRFCPWNTLHDPRELCQSNCLEAFSHFIFMQSQGVMVACDFQGTVQNEGTSASYVITDSIIHSLQKNYGPFDEGENGINEFFKLHKCSSICRGWPVPTPLTPPPSFASLALTPPPAFEDIVFPFPRSTSSEPPTEMRRVASVRGPSSRRRHATGDATNASSHTHTHTHNQVQQSNSSGCLGLLSPDYGCDGQANRERSHSTSMPQRRRFQSARLNCTDSDSSSDNPPRFFVPSVPDSTNAYPSPAIVPSAPPMYEECVNAYPT